MDQIAMPTLRSEIRDLDVAAEHIRRANRIMVMGCSGGGKSTLSQKIAARFGLAYLSIDRDVLWLPGWVQRDRDEQRALACRIEALIYLGTDLQYQVSLGDGTRLTVRAPSLR